MVFIPAATESLPAMPSDTSRPLRAIRIWLLAVAALVAAIVLVGGATRLTESGLSIVEWKPLTGAVPPLTEAAWQAEFDKYKTIPQYQALNSRMTLHEFKTIYWWEWGHRLLGRLIGAVFLLPFVFFLWRGWVAPGLRWRLWSILGLGAVQGAVGWWMVSSGLAERTSVSQYRLAFHLTLACVIFAATIWTWRRLLPEAEVEADGRIRTTAFLLIGLVLVQIYLGALVAGLDAGLVYNTWPHIDGAWVPATDRLFFLAPAWRNFFENDLMVQFVHRLTAYALWIVAVLHALDAWRRLRGGPVVMAAVTIALAVTLQAAVGIATLLYQVPISLALTHQGIAVLILLLVVMHAERITHGRDLRRPLADALPASR